jgi:hypothetical protein
LHHMTDVRLAQMVFRRLLRRRRAHWYLPSGDPASRLDGRP